MIYEYKIYNADNEIIKIQDDVINEYPHFSFDINSGVGALKIDYARNWKEYYNSEDLIIGNKLFIYKKGVDEAVYSGYLNSVELVYENGEQRIRATWYGFVTKLATRILEDSDADTGLNALSEEPGAILEDIIDLADIGITYTGASIDDTSLTVSIYFNTQYALNCITSLMKMCPSDWFWYVDTDNVIYLQQESTTADYTFNIEKDIENLSVEATQDDIVNDVIIAGGTPEGEEQRLYRFSNTGSIDQYGKKTKIINDGRLYDTTSIEYVASSNIQNEVNLNISFDILDNFDNIKPGDRIQLKDQNGGSDVTLWDEDEWDDSYWDSDIRKAFAELITVQRIDYKGDRVTITASKIMPTLAKNLSNVKRNIEEFTNNKNPVNTTT